tara:strand:+ start:402 stop:662 length:261 start_codon:yes stop_codon:yes gene_type:complete
MAVGDVVNGIGVANNVFYYFQPAATVEILITSGIAQTANIGLSNGVTDSYAPNFETKPVKLFITNTNYLVYYASANFVSYSGLQIK